jgi:hypothetical protein
VEPVFVNFAEGLIALSAPTALRPGSLVIPAGLKNTVLASCAEAPWPA